jgi:hypothetical protein
LRVFVTPCPGKPSPPIPCPHLTVRAFLWASRPKPTTSST